MPITGVSEEVASSIKLYAHKQQTSASLLTLMKTGRGEYLHKTYGEEGINAHGGDGNINVNGNGNVNSNDDDKVATDKILMQVRN
jgi:hypothetical protein